MKIALELFSTFTTIIFYLFNSMIDVLFLMVIVGSVFFTLIGVPFYFDNHPLSIIAGITLAIIISSGWVVFNNRTKILSKKFGN